VKKTIIKTTRRDRLGMACLNCVTVLIAATTRCVMSLSSLSALAQVKILLFEKGMEGGGGHAGQEEQCNGGHAS